jgi:hypothetical protein
MAAVAGYNLRRRAGHPGAGFYEELSHPPTPPVYYDDDSNAAVPTLANGRAAVGKRRLTSRTQTYACAH